MASSQALGGSTRCGKILGPSFDKIIKNVAWRKHTNLVAACKSAIDKLETLTELPSISLSSTIPTLSPSDADSLISPLLLALDSASPKIIDPALDALFRLFSCNLIRFELDRSSDENRNLIVFQLIESVCKCCSLGDELVEFSVMKVLLSAIRSSYVVFRGDYLNHIVKTCYNVYLGGLNGTNQICAKAVLAQIMLIVFTRIEEDSMFVNSFRIITVSELLEYTDRNLSEGNSVQLVQNVINDVMESNEGVEDVKQQQSENPMNGNGNGNANSDENPSDGDVSGVKVEENREAEVNMEEKFEGALEVKSVGGLEATGERDSMLREDGFMLFKNLCKLSMKFSSQEHSDDEILLRGKILSLELLKVIMDNSGPVWRSNER